MNRLWALDTPPRAARVANMATISLIEGADDEAVTDWLHGRLSRALAGGDRPVAVTVPGGSTPFPILARLAAMPLDWGRVTVWPGDDRRVPEDHRASNTGRIRALLEPAGAEVVALTVMEDVPHFALAWLGMGGDGHIASLFPNTDPRADDPQRMRLLTPDPLPPEAPFDRITLTIPALLDSDELLFVIRGVDKRALFEAAARGENDLPIARLLAAARQPVTCFT
jgi:6-phosphogluconolactonase